MNHSGLVCGCVWPDLRCFNFWLNLWWPLSLSVFLCFFSFLDLSPAAPCQPAVPPSHLNPSPFSPLTVQVQHDQSYSFLINQSVKFNQSHKFDPQHLAFTPTHLMWERSASDVVDGSFVELHKRRQNMIWNG